VKPAVKPVVKEDRKAVQKVGPKAEVREAAKAGEAGIVAAETATATVIGNVHRKPPQ